MKSFEPYQEIETPDDEVYFASHTRARSTYLLMGKKGKTRWRKCDLCGEVGPNFKEGAKETIETREWRLGHPCIELIILRMAYWGRSPAAALVRAGMQDTRHRNQTQRRWYLAAQKYLRGHWADKIPRKDMLDALDKSYQECVDAEDAYHAETEKIQFAWSRKMWAKEI